MIRVMLFIGIVALQIWSAEPFAVAREVVGSVESKKEDKGKDAWKPVRVGAKLQQKQTIRTGIEAQVRLQFGDGTTMIVQEKSEATLAFIRSEGKTQGADVELSGGRLSFQVRKLVGGQAAYQFRTGTATAAVRGTGCDMGSKDDVTVMGCHEGKVLLQVNASPDKNTELCSPCIVYQSGDNGFSMRRFADLASYRAALESLFAALLDSSEATDPGALFQDSLGTSYVLEWRTGIPNDSARKLLVRSGEVLYMQTPSVAEAEGRWYAFAGWTVDSGAVRLESPDQPATRLTMNGNGRILSAYAPIQVQVQVLASEGGTVVPNAPQQVQRGDEVLLGAEADSGWRFTGWSVDAGIGTIESPLSVHTGLKPVQGPLQITAHFSQHAVYLGFSQTKGGRVDPDSLYADIGADVPLKAVAEQGYVFLGWDVVQGKAMVRDPKSPDTMVRLMGDNVVIVPRFGKTLRSLRIDASDASGQVKMVEVEFR